MADKKAWIVYSEYGEYSDHSFTPLGVALTEAAARAAVEREALADANSGIRGVPRPAREGDNGYEDGFWVVMQKYAADQFLGGYNGTLFGFQETTIAEDA